MVALKMKDMGALRSPFGGAILAAAIGLVLMMSGSAARRWSSRRSRSFGGWMRGWCRRPGISPSATTRGPSSGAASWSSSIASLQVQGPRLRLQAGPHYDGLAPPPDLGGPATRRPSAAR